MRDKEDKYLYPSFTMCCDRCETIKDVSEIAISNRTKDDDLDLICYECLLKEVL